MRHFRDAFIAKSITEIDVVLGEALDSIEEETSFEMGDNLYVRLDDLKQNVEEGAKRRDRRDERGAGKEAGDTAETGLSSVVTDQGCPSLSHRPRPVGPDRLHSEALPPRLEHPSCRPPSLFSLPTPRK